MDVLKEELNIPEKYMTDKEHSILATVHKQWIYGFLNLSPINFITHDALNPDEIASQPSLKELGHNWTRIFIKVYKKKFEKALMLPKDSSFLVSNVETDLTYAQVLHYVAKTNHQSMWKDFFKQYIGPWIAQDSVEQINIGYTSDVELLRDITTRMYSCMIIQLRGNEVKLLRQQQASKMHCNLLPAIIAIETISSFILFYEQTANFTLKECLSYSPAAILSSYSRPLFLTYQILQLYRSVHDCGLLLGNITLNNILIMNNLTLQILPDLTDNIHLVSEFLEILKKKPKDISSDIDKSNKSVNEVCEMWLHGKLNNFEYLTALNILSGRRYGDPNCHHVMPWVTDFSSSTGENWRDLSKSKFRLNKGDIHLDLTFHSNSEEIGYHIPDVLSEITYYVYLARRYPKSILCKHVRSQWVSAEYPASIQRLYEWSPDECIPQFFTDPNVFKSLHNDLPDLGIPNWANSPKDFIIKHREALESPYVTERLHHWIDLTFGYKLSGSAAVKSKNVCLHLVDNHMNLSNSGIVQLFNVPHPQKTLFSPYWSKMPPNIKYFFVNENASSNNEDNSEKLNEERHSSGEDDQDDQHHSQANANRSSPISISRFLSRSRSSLSCTEETVKLEKLNEQTIILPKDYNPASALIQIETTHHFMNKVSQTPYKPRELNSGNYVNQKQIVANSRMKEQQILGCLITEIFLAEKCRALWKAGKMTFQERVNASLSILYLTPKCVRNIIELLLKYATRSESQRTRENFYKYSAITPMGLPPPSAHQILQPILSSLLFPSSKCMKRIYGIMEMIQDYADLQRELELATQNFETNDNLDKQKILYLCKINECKVVAVANELEKFFASKTHLGDNCLQLIVPHVKQIFEQPFSAVLATWYLFDPIARTLGPKETSNIFLQSLLNLYDKGSFMDKQTININFIPENMLTKFKTMRLYHKSFFLKLIVRLGLKCFLENFITPLVEAVGGYRNNLPQISNLSMDEPTIFSNCDIIDNTCDIEIAFSPVDEELTEKQKNYAFDREFRDNKDSSSDIPFSPEQELNDREVFDYASSKVVKSDVIPIPKTINASLAKSVPEFNSIGCKVGSTSDNEDLIIQTLNEENCSQENQENLKQACSLPKESLMCKNKTKNVKKQFIDNECSASEISAESVIWLSHRLGPVLTARYLSRNLLRMLTLCYSGKGNLTLIINSLENSEDVETYKIKLQGDLNACKVLECLCSIVALYGEQVIVLQYLAHMRELITQSKRKISLNLEGGLVSCLVLLNHMIPLLNDSALMDTIHEGIVKSILLPIVKILVSGRYTFPNGAMARSILVHKYLETLAILISRLGNIMAKNHLSVLIARLLSGFDKNFNKQKQDVSDSITSSSKDKLNIKNQTADLQSSTMTLSTSPDHKKSKAREELEEVFSASLAHKIYILLYRLLSDEVMNELLQNHQIVTDLYHEYEQELLFPTHLDNKTGVSVNTINNAFGKILSVSNRINLEEARASAEKTGSESFASKICGAYSSTGRQLRGNWLAYWEHEIGRSEKDTKFNFKQIKLQTFSGHTNSVKCMYILDNENSFMSGSRDKTVKLWSLRSQGDGTTNSSCQFTYTSHKKSIIATTFLESLRYAVTCDGSIHCWDPFMGSFVGSPDSSKLTPINVLVANPAPSTTILVASADVTVRGVDCRTFQLANEMKVSTNPSGLIRCIATAPSGNWIALGQATGFLTILDIRTGLIIASWKGHECEILQLQALNETTIISSSLDQSMALWSAVDGKLKFYLKGVSEPVHCISTYEQQLISGTTANRIGVHSAVDANESFTFSKLRYEAFKGILTSMSLLSLNRLLLLGADNGSISLIC